MSSMNFAKTKTLAMSKRWTLKESMGIGTAAVSHQAKTQTITASMVQLATGPSSFTHRHIMVHRRGHRKTDNVLSVRVDFKPDRKLCDRWIGSLS